jgi:hypothetical protein
MKLYHGSTIDIAEVDLALSKPNKDFGRAFYLSDDRQQALEMAQFRAEFEETEPHGRTLHDYDIVYGPIANDRVGAQIARYKQGYITFDEFLRRIQYIKGITFQYAFCTQRAIDKLIKVK